MIGSLVVLLGVLMSGLTGWSDLNSVHQDVDVVTGRVRQTRYLFCCKVSESVHDTILTGWLPAEQVAAAQPDWRRVNTFSGLSNVSPHHTFHGAIGDIRRLDVAQSWVRLTDKAKQAAAERIVRLWQDANNDSEAGNYITRLESKAADFGSTQGNTLTVQDLP